VFNSHVIPLHGLTLSTWVDLLGGLFQITFLFNIFKYDIFSFLDIFTVQNEDLLTLSILPSFISTNFNNNTHINKIQNNYIIDLNNNPSITNLELKLKNELKLMPEGKLKTFLAHRLNTPKEDIIINSGILDAGAKTFTPVITLKLTEGLKLIPLGFQKIGSLNQKL
jgi:hypothetical protein